jgi:murein DD-endopeptidase MepM/ murein hydrolase activator NlpD
MPPNKRKIKTVPKKSGLSQEERRRKAASQPLGGGGPPPGYNSRKGAYSTDTNYNARSKRITRILTIIMAIIMLIALIGSMLVSCIDTTSVQAAQELPNNGFAQQNSTPLSYSRVRYLGAPDPGTPPTASLPAPSNPLPEDTIYVGETGHYIKNPFLRYWQAKGGADLPGNPLSEEFSQNGRSVQLFERALLEFHSQEKGTKLEIQGGFLGRQLAEALKLNFSPTTDTTSNATRTYFKETRQSISGTFKTYWDRNDGLNLLGFPIGEAFSESEGLSVQYFERGRLEQAGSNPVRLSNSGDLLLEAMGWPRPVKLPLELNIADTEIYQGRTLSIRLDNNGKWQPSEIRGRLGDTALNIYRVNGVFKALNPFDPRTEPKTYSLQIEFSDPANRLRQISQPITVVKFDFPLQRLYIPVEKNETLDAEIEAAENNLLEPIYKIITPQPYWSGRWGLPSPNANDSNISTEFAQRRAYNDSPTFNYYHGGIDYSEPMGAPIWAPAAGRVVFTDPDLTVRGGTVIIDHGLGVQSLYFHMSAITVKKDQMVKPGDVLGRVGTTGRSSGPHLHWEVRVNGIITDPRLFQKQDLSR